jgi:aminopeptidase N
MSASQKLRRLAVVPIALLAACLAAPPASAHRAAPGAPDVGDYLFPGLGNGGYDARHYTLALRYPTAAPLQPEIAGVVRMDAIATQRLSRFNLDFAGDSVAAVSVNGRRAEFRREAEELVITPRSSLKARHRFTADVVFTTHNFTPDPGDIIPFGWFTTLDGSVTAFQPNLAHLSYPVNDHPSDKATYSFFVDVPTGVVVAANGVRTGRRTSGDRTLWKFEERNPMASELVQIATGDLTVIERGRAAGVPIRDVTSTTSAPVVEPALARTPTHMRWMVDRVGRYPFENYGVLSADQFFLYALETQTLSLHPTLLFDPSVVPGVTGEPWFYEPIMVHELAHQWFGDSVAPERWSDVWLNEGHATWYEREWEQETGQIDENGFASFEAFMRDQYAKANQYRAEFGPVAHPTHNDLFGLFSDNVYGGGALVLFALQQKVGDATFRAIERGWAQRKRGESVGTGDFIRFASRVAHRDLGPFLRDWLFGETAPPMPGHPDWEADPVEAAAPAHAASALSARGAELRGRGDVSLRRD